MLLREGRRCGDCAPNVCVKDGCPKELDHRTDGRCFSRLGTILQILSFGVFSGFQGQCGSSWSFSWALASGARSLCALFLRRRGDFPQTRLGEAGSAAPPNPQGRTSLAQRTRAHLRLLPLATLVKTRRLSPLIFGLQTVTKHVT